MDLPFFFSETLERNSTNLVLDEPASRHAVQVLRMDEDEELRLVNGKGVIAKAVITDAHKRKTAVQVIDVTYQEPPLQKVTIAISLVKNAARFEWFLEKATEIGVSEIIPLLCHRTERQVFRQDRMRQIIVSAMLQSQQVWMPRLHEPEYVERLIPNATASDRYVAHCMPSEKTSLTSSLHASGTERLILIGPEGDLNAAEVDLALQHGFKPVSLGDNRLRTETAGIVAATLLKMC